MGEETADLELRGARGITTFVSGGHTYAAVAAYFSDSVQILNITDPSNITAAGNITDIGTNTDSLELNGASGITTFVSGSHTYAAVAASLDDGVQILNVTDPSDITAAGHITDDGTNSPTAWSFGMRVASPYSDSYQASTHTPQSQHMRMTASRY